MDRALLSDGQAQVWQIAAEVLTEYRLDPVTTDENHHAEAYQALLKRLASNPLIRQDRYTGCLIVDKQVANSYINWLTTKCLKADRVVKKNPPSMSLPIDFNRMVFGGSTNGKQKLDFTLRMYTGGEEKRLSTARAVLTLAAGADLYLDEIEIEYFANSRIMKYAGGNHRLMAYKLLGITSFPTDRLRANKLTVYEDIPDEKLNQALLCLERLERSPDPRDSKIKAVGDEERILNLATKFGANTSDSGPNELVRFFKQDLLDNPAPTPYNQENPFLDLLSNYAAAYFPADQAGPIKAWFTGGYTGKNANKGLPEDQKAIRERLRAWRKMQQEPK